MNHVPKVLLSVATIAIASTVFAAEASAQEQEEESVGMSANKGFKLGFAPMLLLPMRDNGPWGGGLELQARYGIKAGGTVFAPGGMLGGYTISGRFLYIAMPTVRWTVPIGPVAPYIVGGAGYGGFSNPGQDGFAALGGGGMMIHLGHVIAIGAELTYRTITNTGYDALVFGPQIAFGG